MLVCDVKENKLFRLLANNLPLKTNGIMAKHVKYHYIHCHEASTLFDALRLQGLCASKKMCTTTATVATSCHIIPSIYT